jgi:hypothetical protein
MNEILENEIKRQEDMDIRFRTLDEEQFKPIDDFTETHLLGDPLRQSTNQEEREKELRELKELEDAYLNEIDKILMEIPNDDSY